MAGVIGAWVLSKVWDARGVKDEIVAIKKAQATHELEVDKWQSSHELEAAERDKIMRSMEMAVGQLKLIADYSERRLSILESRDKPGAVERIHDRIDELAKKVCP